MNFTGCRNMWGTLVPFNKLPPEVLSQVILMGLENDQEEKHRYELFMESEIAYDTASESDSSEDETLDEDDPEYGILSYKEPVPFSVIFSHVCRRWRDVALSTANAWTAIDFRNPDDWTLECLARSKCSPLTVFIDVAGTTESIKSWIFCSLTFLALSPSMSGLRSNGTHLISSIQFLKRRKLSALIGSDWSLRMNV
ncbi:hypothetical protein FRC03_003524 [Tulasnella sp. 419]|nr:hypothetical protein FRC03_003524 [Tulasnella sp. 419]